jgi:hypothetical protein
MFAKSRFGVGAALGGVRHSVVSYGSTHKGEKPASLR